MKTTSIFKLKWCTPQLVFLLTVFTFLIFISCDKKLILEPEGPERLEVTQLPELTDAIPYDKLGSGTIVFERIGYEYSGCYVIDVDQRKTWGFDFSLSLSQGYCISPDGSKIAFTLYYGQESYYDVYLVNIDGTNLVKLDALSGMDLFPSWSPDGSKIFFREASVPDKLYSKSPIPHARDLRMIKEFNQDPSGAVSVSSTGKIAYVVTNMGLYTMDMDGKNLNRIVQPPQNRNFESPVFSPDGQKITYLSAPNNSTQIEILQVNTEGGPPVLLTTLTANGQNNYVDTGKFNSVYLTGSPDGSKFLVNIPEGYNVSHLYLLNSDGSNLTQVTFTKGVTDRCVSWGR